MAKRLAGIQKTIRKGTSRAAFAVGTALMVSIIALPANGQNCGEAGNYLGRGIDSIKAELDDRKRIPTTIGTAFKDLNTTRFPTGEQPHVYMRAFSSTYSFLSYYAGRYDFEAGVGVRPFAYVGAAISQQQIESISRDVSNKVIVIDALWERARCETGNLVPAPHVSGGDLKDFRARYGDTYIKSVTVGARYYGVWTSRNFREESLSQLQSILSVEGNYKKVGVDFSSDTIQRIQTLLSTSEWEQQTKGEYSNLSAAIDYAFNFQTKAKSATELLAFETADYYGSAIPRDLAKRRQDALEYVRHSRRLRQQMLVLEALTAQLSDQDSLLKLLTSRHAWLENQEAQVLRDPTVQPLPDLSAADELVRDAQDGSKGQGKEQRYRIEWLPKMELHYEVMGEKGNWSSVQSSKIQKDNSFDEKWIGEGDSIKAMSLFAVGPDGKEHSDLLRFTYEVGTYVDKWYREHGKSDCKGDKKECGQADNQRRTPGGLSNGIWAITVNPEGKYSSLIEMNVSLKGQPKGQTVQQQLVSAPAGKEATFSRADRAYQLSISYRIKPEYVVPKNYTSLSTR